MRKKNIARILLITASLLLVSGCGGKDPEALITSARAFLDKGDEKSAIIELKTALQDKPNLPEARYLLGKALLDSGDANGAALELQRALELRHDEEEVIPSLARALYLKGDLQRLLDQFGQTTLKDALSQADLKVTLAKALGGLGRREPARQAIQAALAASPDYGPAVIVEARLQADQGDIGGALATIDAHLRRSPQDAEAWQVKGDLLYVGQQDSAGALAAYKQAATVDPTFMPASAGIMTVHLGNGDLENAKTQLDALRKAHPKHPQTLYYVASVSLLAKDLDQAKEASDQLLRILPDVPRVLQLAGSVEFERKSFGLAEAHLAKALQADPKLDAARRILVATYLQRAEPAKALSALQPLLDGKNPPVQVFSMLAQAQLMSGNLDEAETAFARVAKLKPDDPRNRTAYAVSRILRGDDKAGIAELRTVAAGEDGVVADLPLIAALMKRRDFGAALVAIDGLEKKQPDKPFAANLRARVLIQQDKRAEAQMEFRRALKIQPTFFPAAMALAQIATQDRQLDGAIAVIDEFLKSSPGHSQALVTSAALYARKGAGREQIIGIFDNAIRLAPLDPTPRLALINYQLGVQEVKAAVASAQQAVAALPNNAVLMDALGRSQAAAGEKNQAVVSFGKLAQLLPNSPDPHLRVADVHWAAQDAESALQAMKRALSVDPDNLRAQRGMVDIYLATDREREAVAVAQQILDQRPKQDVGFLIRGGIESQKRRWPETIRVFKAGLEADPDSTEIATRLHVAYTASNQQAEATKLAADWLRQHPKDARFKFYLGDAALSKRALDEAEKMYRQVLELQPDNALALNNVAWLMAASKRKGAVEMAEKAVALLPDRPVIMDTLAIALAAEGQVAKAVDIMRQAVRLEDKNPQLRFNLAKLLVDAGDKAAAKTELETLAKLGEKFPRHGEVKALLNTL